MYFGICICRSCNLLFFNCFFDLLTSFGFHLSQLKLFPLLSQSKSLSRRNRAFRHHHSKKAGEKEKRCETWWV